MAVTDGPGDSAEQAKKPDVNPATFFALDIRAGKVVVVEAFPEATKPAYKVSVDFGPGAGTLSTSAQITNYPEEKLLGRMVVGAINLGPKMIAGHKSDFLILGTFE